MIHYKPKMSNIIAAGERIKSQTTDFHFQTLPHFFRYFKKHVKEGGGVVGG